jgi:ferredoxin-type protein NapG
MPDDQAQAVPAPEQGLTRRQAIATGGGIVAGCVIGLGYNAGDRTGNRSLALRPPGALIGHAFLAACIRCGQCVEACPYDTLRLMGITSGVEAGTPTFTAVTNPCWMCQGYDSLRCIDVCPTNALEKLDDPMDARMGTAVIDESDCWAYNGTMCRACWHACPYPDQAIVYDEMLRPTVNADVCTGCGLCEHGCPTEKVAIRIKPRGSVELTIGGQSS